MSKTPPNSIHPKTRTEWRAWLEQHHTRAESVWLINYKKATGQPRFEYDEAVEEALCFGWIDSKGNKLDEEVSEVRAGHVVWAAVGVPHGVKNRGTERLTILMGIAPAPH